MTSGRFVAATMVTPTSSCTPSISFRRLVKTPSCAPPLVSEEEREVANASISSYGQVL